jgi:hypothetical protein
MATIDITGGPEKGELMTRMLSDQPVTFVTIGGPIDIRIQEMQETDASGDHITFVGRIVVGSHMGAHVEGQYDCPSNAGTMTVTANGV